MKEKIHRKRVQILRILKTADRGLRCAFISDELLSQGMDFSERTVRHYLHDMAREGLIERADRRQYKLTDQGMAALDAAAVVQRVGFLSAKIDQMTYKMGFTLQSRKGTVVVNITVVEPKHLYKCIKLIQRVYAEGYAMGKLAALLMPGETVGSITVPEKMVGIATVCSISLNGVLLEQGIPTASRFGGLLEIKDRAPQRFSEIIMYEGTSIDPLEIFIRSAMTDYIGAVTSGNGKIGVSFREFPADSRERVLLISEKLSDVGLGGFLEAGRPGQPLFEIPVSEGRFGAVVIGGLNPMAILEEKGVRVYSRALAGLLDFGKLFHYEALEKRVKALL